MLIGEFAMNHGFLLSVLCLTIAASGIHADEPAKPAAATKATFSITGLHCPPCTRTVEASLRGVKGVRSASVDWSTKTAKVEFDEKAVSVQQISSAVASTPHMMGGGLKYGSWLALSVPDLKDDGAAKTASAAIGKLPGVANVTPFIPQHSVSVQFSSKGAVTTAELIDALTKAGLAATTY
jgi:copper chaperone CopZ